MSLVAPWICTIVQAFLAMIFKQLVVLLQRVCHCMSLAALRVCTMRWAVRVAMIYNQFVTSLYMFALCCAAAAAAVAAACVRPLRVVRHLRLPRELRHQRPPV